MFNFYFSNLLLAAIRWRDGLTGVHVDYDQCPDVFRFEIAMLV